MSSFRSMIRAPVCHSTVPSVGAVTDPLSQLQPLATCMHNLQIEKMAIGLQISEPWLREYQVCFN